MKVAQPKDISPTEFAAALRMHRERLGLTQAEAALLCRVSLRTWVHWEHAAGGAPLYPTMRGALDILQTTMIPRPPPK